MVTSKSTPLDLARDALFAVDTMTRSNYDVLRSRLIPMTTQLSPAHAAALDHVLTTRRCL
ncbi:MAG TPA: hypothetical protein VGC42_09795 [Kofleriaceae bacterium]